MTPLFPLALLPLSLLSHVASAAGPGSPDFYNTVGVHFKSSNCSDESLIWADPVWGTGGYCRLLDRFDQEEPIMGYKVVTQYTGCSITLYASTDCTGEGVPASMEECVEHPEDRPFESVFAVCPFSDDFPHKV